MTDLPVPEAPLTSRAESAALLRERPFIAFITARFCASIAVQIQSVTIGWQVYNLARQGRSVKEAAFVLSMIGLIQFLPVLGLTLPAGQMADSHDRKRIVQLSLTVDVICALVLTGFALFKPMLWPIFAVALVFGASRAFLGPASGAIVPMLVPRRLMPRGLAWSSLGWQTASIVGPAVGGVICAISTAAGYGVSAAIFLAAILMLFTVKANTKPVRHPGSRWEMVKEGLSYVWREKIVFGAISLDLFAVLLGGATLLLPVFAADVLHVGAEGFGILQASTGVGAALVALYLANWPVRRHAGIVMFSGVAAFALATIVFGLSRSLPLSALALALVGGADMLSVYVRQTLIQIVTPDAMRGRVAAVSSLFIGASNELGEFESGLVARVLGPVGAALFGGVGALVVTGVWARMFPALRKADRLVV